MPFGMKPCTEAGCFADDGEIACSLTFVVAVVVYVLDVLIESDVDFPSVRHLSLNGADAPGNVEFTHGGVILV